LADEFELVVRMLLHEAGVKRLPLIEGMRIFIKVARSATLLARLPELANVSPDD
jgi:hypothetical protein